MLAICEYESVSDITSKDDYLTARMIAFGDNSKKEFSIAN